MLIFVDNEDKIRNIDEIDGIINAEISDESTNPHLYKITKQFRIHGPCGQQNLNSPGMGKHVEQYTKKFPKQIINNTIITSG